MVRAEGVGMEKKGRVRAVEDVGAACCVLWDWCRWCWAGLCVDHPTFVTGP